MFKKRKYTKPLLVIIISLISIQFSFAGRFWVNTPVEIDGRPIHSYQSAMGMRSEHTWPVIAYDNHGRGFTTATLTPTGWVNGPSISYHCSIGGISAATSSDSKVCFATGDGHAMMLDHSGWMTLPNYLYEPMYGKPSVAFDDRGQPAIAHNRGNQGHMLTLARYTGSGWYRDNVGSPYEEYHPRAFALGFDSFGQANVVFADGEFRYAVKGQLTMNQWQVDEVPEDMWLDTEYMDMAIGAGDVPWVVYSNDYNKLQYSTYDRQLQKWVSGIISNTEHDSFFDVVCDNQGGIGVAFIDEFEMLGFAYTDGLNGWELSTGIAHAENYADVSLTFDRENNPVICYTDGEGLLSIAYDPIMVPEPATMVMLAVGGIAMVCKRRNGR